IDGNEIDVAFGIPGQHGSEPRVDDAKRLVWRGEMRDPAALAVPEEGREPEHQAGNLPRCGRDERFGFAFRLLVGVDEALRRRDSALADDSDAPPRDVDGAQEEEPLEARARSRQVDDTGDGLRVELTRTIEGQVEAGDRGRVDDVTDLPSQAFDL